ncbi:MAG: hypothetical protein A2Y53_00025 [Chloroflexi bacterium RBG_16_47_49]|nr:MAG: hypothetical protein A2Y53_00025 [Chloroflexi bacterium RBG_16_47_49]
MLRKKTIKLACEDCGLPYRDFPLDTTVSDNQWSEIHPENGGVLCASCMVKRASHLPGIIAARMVFEFVPSKKEAIIIILVSRVFIDDKEI